MALSVDCFADSPLACYARPDGKSVLFAGDRDSSPYMSKRNPLYCWEIDRDNDFAANNRRVIMDSFDAEIPIAEYQGPIVDFPRLLPHAGGKTQAMIHCVRSVGMFKEEADMGGPARVLADDDFHATAIYRATVHYDEPQSASWRFADEVVAHRSAR